MATSGLDVISIFGALYELEKETIGLGRVWRAKNRLQEIVFDLYRKNKIYLPDYKNSKVKIFSDFLALNDFLGKNGFAPMFKYPLSGPAAVSVVDIWIEWLYPGERCGSYAFEGTPGFEIPAAGFNSIQRIQGSDELRTSIKTKSGEPFWYSITGVRPEGTENLFQMEFGQVEDENSPRLYRACTFPEVTIDLLPDMFFLLGADYLATGGEYWHIQHAYQHYKLRMNWRGAHAKVATAIAIRRGFGSSGGRSLRDLDRVQIDWLASVPPKLPFPFFYADFDSWKPVESLDDI